MMRSSDEMVLDGNAAAGLLSQIFVPDVTAAMARCAHCGANAPVGAVALHQGAGAVLRCRSCGGVLLRIVSAPGRWYIELTGIRCLELPSA
jgi:Family of unknown function (DUF6510)